MSQLDFDFSRTALDLLLAKLAGRHVVASISGGRDSGAMGLLLKELGIEHTRMFMNTQWENPITTDYVRGPLTAALGPITEIAAEKGFLDLVKHKGLFPSRVMRFCTTELKVLPAQRYLNVEDEALATAGEIVNAVGIRRAESKARSEMSEWEWSDGFDCEIWRPLVTWTAADVEAIHVRHGLAMNPLYEMGASRVGCWPCIYAGKKEIAFVARVDPERIALIDATERALNEAGAAKDNEIGRPFVPRSMFSYGGGGRKHVPLPIYQAVEWANSKRGEWHPPGAGDGCMRPRALRDRGGLMTASAVRGMLLAIELVEHLQRGGDRVGEEVCVKVDWPGGRTTWTQGKLIAIYEGRAAIESSLGPVDGDADTLERA